MLVQQGLMKGLYGKVKKPEMMTNDELEELDMKAISTIRLCLADELTYDVVDDVSTAAIWLKLESQYMSKSVKNKINLKQKLYELKMVEGADLVLHNHKFNQIISDLLWIKIKFVGGKETLIFEEILGALLDHYQWR